MRSIGIRKHGHAAKNDGTRGPSKVYSAWRGMKTRCYNPRSHYFWRYGGRGIRVCKKWRDNFESFYQDVGDPPTRNHTLDRFPNRNGNYEPGNVRWATKRQQIINRDGKVFCDGRFVKDREAARLVRESIDNVRYWSQYYSSDIRHIANYVKLCRSAREHPRLANFFKKRNNGLKHARRAKRARLERAKR